MMLSLLGARRRNETRNEASTSCPAIQGAIAYEHCTPAGASCTSISSGKMRPCTAAGWCINRATPCARIPGAGMTACARLEQLCHQASLLVLRSGALSSGVKPNSPGLVKPIPGCARSGQMGCGSNTRGSHAGALQIILSANPSTRVATRHCEGGCRVTLGVNDK